MYAQIFKSESRRLQAKCVNNQCNAQLYYGKAGATFELKKNEPHTCASSGAGPGSGERRSWRLNVDALAQAASADLPVAPTYAQLAEWFKKQGLDVPQSTAYKVRSAISTLTADCAAQMRQLHSFLTVRNAERTKKN